MPKLLFITSELPYPLHSGGKVKTWYMLNSLAAQYDITMACTLKAEDELHTAEFIQKAPIEKLLCEPVKRSRSAVNLAASYLEGVPLNVLRTQSTELAAQINHIADTFDLILVDHYESFQYVPNRILESPFTRPKVVYHAHNAYHQMWARFAEKTTNLAYKLVCKFEAMRVACYERRVCNHSQLVFAAPNDIHTLSGIGCLPTHMHETLHLGDDNLLKLPKLTLDDTTPRLFYAGFLGWEPNVLGLIWFLQEVWPTLKQRFPELMLDIAGKNPDERLQHAVQQVQGVQLLGFVEDLDTLYRRSRACICPLQFGSGIKVKVVSAMARGLPVVTTSVGAEGLRVKSGEHLHIADTAQATVAAVSELLTDNVQWRRLSNNSRKLVRKYYTWDAVFTPMQQEMQQLLCDSPFVNRAIPTVKARALA